MTEHIFWYGHASTKLNGEKVVYIDPYQMPDTLEEKADIILITHSHFDHCSPGDIRKISDKNTVIVCPVDCAESIDGSCQEIVKGDIVNIKGITIEAVPAYNVDKAFHPKNGNGLGYIVNLNGKRIYQAGDTDFIEEMKGLTVDVAILPIGGTYTMNATEAAEAVKAVKPELAIPIHFGTVVGSMTDAEKFQRQSDVPVKILAVSSK